MRRMTTVVRAVLLHLESLTVVDLGLHRDVVAPLALGALEGDLHPLVISGNVAGSLFLILVRGSLDDFGDAAGADGTTTLTDGKTQTLIHRDRDRKSVV